MNFDPSFRRRVSRVLFDFDNEVELEKSTYAVAETISNLDCVPALQHSAVLIAACSPSYDLTLAIVRIQIAGFEMEKNSARRKLSLKRKKSFSSGTSTQYSDD